MDRRKERNITQIGGLNQDSALTGQPPGSARYVLNGVNETSEGSRGFRANEESNSVCHLLANGSFPIGEVYIGNNETAIFSVKGMDSYIGIVDTECNYKMIFTDEDQSDKMGFSLMTRIDAIFRLRLGCERTLYWVDPKIRTFTIDKPTDFKKSDGSEEWDISKFSLSKNYNLIPVFEEITIEETGALLSGGYNFSIQYLDENLNGTEFIQTTEVIKIYNDSVNKTYPNIEGSTNKVTDAINFGPTNKSIKLVLGNLDSNYLFYRIAIVESTNGSGQISAVKYSQEIPIEIDTFTYDGTNYQTEGTEKDILMFAAILDEADHIEQIENRLVLGSPRGRQINLCNLQKYASRIKVDMITKEIFLNVISESNPKTGTVDFDGTGYMPGEIYSLAIVWVLEGGLVLPALHIPGKAASTAGMAFTEGAFPMALNNICEDTFYTDSNTCSSEGMWGLDSEGNELTGENVRHHRFPLRTDVKKPLVQRLDNITDPILVNNIYLTIEGDIEEAYPNAVVSYTVLYTIDGLPYSYNGIIDKESYMAGEVQYLEITIPGGIGTVVVTGIEEDSAVVVGTSVAGLTYTTEIIEEPFTTEETVYTSEIFGLRLSGIDYPTTEDTGGLEVLGYYIVRNERTESNKTILDSAVLTPLLEEPYFIAHGHLVPELDNTDRIKDDMVAMIHPEHKFNGREYKNTPEILRQGEFQVIGEPAISNVRIQDVMPGTSYDPEVSKRREKDGDGFTLHTLTRDNELNFIQKNEELPEPDEIFYLDTLSSKTIDYPGIKKEVFNLAIDNKIGIVKLSEGDTFNKEDLNGRLPYVILRRQLANPYSNYRISPYYKDSKNLEVEEVAEVFGGDTYITPMRYHNSVYYDTRLRKRASKSGIFNVIIGVLATIAGAVLAVVTLGGSTALSAMLIGWGVAQIATGIKKEQLSKVYGELYDAGLKNTVQDNRTSDFFNRNPPDDEIQWLGDTLTNLWFESTVNMGLRHGLTADMPDFLESPVKKAIGNPHTSPTSTIGLSTYAIGPAYGSTPLNELDAYILDKLTVLDADSNDGRLYQGFGNAEYYSVNPDYMRGNKQKIFNHLPLEYDCCSECSETFPHRVYNSEPSFQEELTDNYRIILPNNYRDIEGEFGKITDLFKRQNRLYIHTEEALWELPANVQERVTGDIISFIGTGEFFSLPPKRITDDKKSSAGNRHKWATLETENGVLFPTDNQKRINLFDGNSLKPISSIDMFSWFKNNMGFLAADEYYNANGKPYPFVNNPSHPLGIGYVSVYDTRKERYIITKKDFKLANLGTDYEICSDGDSAVIFHNYQATIDSYADEGFTFAGIEDCRMKFTKTIYSTTTEIRYEYGTVPSTIDIHIFYDTSGSFGAYDGEDMLSIRAAVADWLAAFGAENFGEFFEYQTNPDNGEEQWVSFPEYVEASYPPGTDMSTKDILLISFCNESSDIYHTTFNPSEVPDPTINFIADYIHFKDNIYPTFKSFIGVHYPIIFTTGDEGLQSASKALLQMVLAALKGVDYTPAQISALAYNPGFTPTEWNNMKNTLLDNPYPDDGLENYGWRVQPNRNNIGEIINAEQFGEDINEILSAEVVVTEVEVEVQVPSISIVYEDGEPIELEDLIEADNSWTISYSLKENSWVSWHSYLPAFYYYVADEFFSWKQLNTVTSNIWKHNMQGNFQTFYGTYYPHIIEYVPQSRPITKNSIWEGLMFQTEARVFIALYQDFIDKKDITFNKIIAYNSRQITGLQNMVVKDTTGDPEDYMLRQVQNVQGQILLDRNERDWTINDLRDYRINYDIPMFRRDLLSLQSEYPIDKILNAAAVSFNKDWTQLESFRDKFLVVRLIFDTFDDVNLITHFSVEDENPSER